MDLRLTNHQKMFSMTFNANQLRRYSAFVYMDKKTECGRVIFKRIVKLENITNLLLRLTEFNYII